MRNRLKRFLLIFMMLALPVQAFASVTLLACDMAIPAAISHESMASMDQAMNGCHEDAANKARPPAGDHKCSHCSACYLGGAFPIPASPFASLTPIPHTPHLQPAEAFNGFIPEGPERPPRSSLA